MLLIIKHICSASDILRFFLPQMAKINLSGAQSLRKSLFLTKLLVGLQRSAVVGEVRTRIELRISQFKSSPHQLQLHIAATYLQRLYK
jgi:hypothetical protein